MDLTDTKEDGSHNNELYDNEMVWLFSSTHPPVCHSNYIRHIVIISSLFLSIKRIRQQGWCWKWMAPSLDSISCWCLHCSLFLSFIVCRSLSVWVCVGRSLSLSLSLYFGGSFPRYVGHGTSQHLQPGNTPWPLMLAAMAILSLPR